ncbi:hypothetical protein AMATHDRAFT_75922 [Amanita thiersii Skay4041]|uniref:Uncharacterized protein n=1 Tax=Amanita thiersii Skay4041 TaxID=703135 RepID=A0A2A9NH16_9AGAR|nr:hypothetical protein AMATHDRAFT_75922 [Amanita thiersii Skay4041]
MMLVQKQAHFPLSPLLAHSHRRNPSAPPAVIVQPTRTPGLLSLSKPARPAPPQQRQIHAQSRQQRSTPKPRQPLAPTFMAVSRPAADSVPSDKKSPLPATFNITTTASPSPQTRGRNTAKNTKEKASTMRSSSHTSLRGRPARQPSPPLPPAPLKTPPAEGPVTKFSQSSNLFDPFLDETLQNKFPPTLSNIPSGKLARRRQPLAEVSPPTVPSTPSPVPIPQSNGNNRLKLHNISRSDPVLSHMPQHRVTRRSSTIGSVPWDVFPICDDMTDAGDVSDNDIRSPPTTPTCSRQNNFKGPRTAPLSGTFPLSMAPSSVPQKARGRKHRRSPSEGVFNMSSDDDTTSGLSLNPSVLALFQLARTPGTGRRPMYASPYKTPAPVTPKYVRDSTPAALLAKERQSEKEAAEKAAGYFASSSFQNSPSPEELPDPLFV